MKYIILIGPQVVTIVSDYMTCFVRYAASLFNNSIKCIVKNSRILSQNSNLT